MSVPHFPFTLQNHKKTRDFVCLFISVCMPCAWKDLSKHLSAYCVCVCGPSTSSSVAPALAALVRLSREAGPLLFFLLLPANLDLPYMSEETLWNCAISLSPSKHRSLKVNDLKTKGSTRCLLLGST